MAESKYKVGDWVAFYSAGEIVIDEIKYINRCPVLSHFIYSTFKNGTTNDDCILEKRSKEDK